MARLLINIGGATADIDRLTATPEMVKINKKFIGKGSDDEQIGVLPEITPEVIKLSANQSYTIPWGIHITGGKVEPNITIKAGEVIAPGAADQIILCNGCYMSGDIIVSATENLHPWNIKKGSTVGGVVGIFEGWADDY